MYFSYHSPTYYSLQSFCLSQIFISQQETSDNQRKIKLYILYINQFISKCVLVIKTLNYFSINYCFNTSTYKLIMYVTFCYIIIDGE